MARLSDHPGGPPEIYKDGRPNKLLHYPIRPGFQGVSYARRYELFCRRLVRKRVYDAACFYMSSDKGGQNGEYSEPSKELSFANCAAPFRTRAAAETKERRPAHGSLE